MASYMSDHTEKMTVCDLQFIFVVIFIYFVILCSKFEDTLYTVFQTQMLTEKPYTPCTKANNFCSATFKNSTKIFSSSEKFRNFNALGPRSTEFSGRHLSLGHPVYLYVSLYIVNERKFT